MFKIMQKLRSRSGASMLLAMVFMMFCTFVGGTVLAAATANGNRVAQQIHDQQSYLNQRSALLVIADQLKGNSENGLQMTISVDHSKATVKQEDGTLKEIESESTPSIKYNVAVPTSFQTMLYDLVKSQKGYNPAMPLSESEPATITITDPGSNELIANYSMDNNYNFTVSFEQGGMSLYLEASVGNTETQRQVLNADGRVQTIITKTTVIHWDDPVIKKGGA